MAQSLLIYLSLEIFGTFKMLDASGRHFGLIQFTPSEGPGRLLDTSANLFVVFIAEPGRIVARCDGVLANEDCWVDVDVLHCCLLLRCNWKRLVGLFL